MDSIAINLIIGLICGVICAIISSNKGRNTVGWFFLGFLFGLIPLIIVACLSNLKEAESKEKAQNRENRRLKEQLRQERIKNETFRKHTLDRLDNHDRVLEISTRNPKQIAASNEALENNQDAYQCLTCNNLYVMDQSDWATQGYCCYECLNRQPQQTQPDDHSYMTLEEKSRRFTSRRLGQILASCSQGHEFEVSEMYQGTIRTCPTCLEKVSI